MRLFHGDCMAVMAALPDASVDAVVTDPPYGINFMGKAWDGAAIRDAAANASGDHLLTNERSASMHAGRYDLAPEAMRAFQFWTAAWAGEAMRVLKPGGYLLSFASTRTFHRMTCGIEDAGFEIRDTIAWMYGSGFPKSLDIAKAIDKAAGAVREVVGSQKDGMGAWNEYRHDGKYTDIDESVPVTIAATDDAKRWDGWGTALKPGYEPVAVARKPFPGTTIANVVEHGTGALNIDACRIGGDKDAPRIQQDRATSEREEGGRGFHMKSGPRGGDDRGRWPANVMLDPDAAAELDEQSGILTSGANPASRGADKDRTAYGEFAGQEDASPQRGLDRGGASRFFYVAKPGREERDLGTFEIGGNAHPTVKPIDLMRQLVRLVTPPGGVVLDPFAGSGTTLLAARREGFRAIGIEMTDDYLPIIAGRLRAEPTTLFGATA